MNPNENSDDIIIFENINDDKIEIINSAFKKIVIKNNG